MGCGLVSQRRPSVEGRHPLGLEPRDRAPAPLEEEGLGQQRRAPGPPAAREAPGGRESAEPPGARAASSSAGTPHGRAHGHRLASGERVVLAPRPPGNPRDHAFCFECGVFFHVGSQRSPQCSRCGGTFVQYLRSAGDQNWISSHSTAGVQYSFDDQLDTSITASLDEAPIVRKPTQAAFLRGLPTWQLTAEDLDERQELESADPRRNCSICRERFLLGETLRRLPCGHEFHGACIAAWLRTQNTCPICRWRAPEAAEEEEEGQGEEAIGEGEEAAAAAGGALHLKRPEPVAGAAAEAGPGSGEPVPPH